MSRPPAAQVTDSYALLVGSGSTYVYGYCDATYQEGWGRDETVNFVKNSASLLWPFPNSFNCLTLITALALAMSRDGSSGGVIRMCVITESGVERLFIPGNELPKFWEGEEVLGKPLKRTDVGAAPMEVEA